MAAALRRVLPERGRSPSAAGGLEQRSPAASTAPGHGCHCEPGRLAVRRRTRPVSAVLLLALALLLATAAVASDERPSTRPGKPHPVLALVDLDGGAVDPFQSATNSKAIVFVFMGVDCPIANRYAPELRRLYKKFTLQKVDWWLVYPGADHSAETIRKRISEFNHAGKVLRDPKLALVRKAQAKVTPEAAVFLRDGRLVYHGRIDDRHPELGTTRPTPTRRDLERALEEILANKPVSQPSTKAVGCLIEGLP